MKKIYYPLMAVAIAASLVSCGGDEPSPSPTPIDPTPSNPDNVEVTISTATIETKAAVLEFGSEAKMNIFAKENNQITASNIVDNVVATFNGSTWTMSPKVYINQTVKNAYVYAVSPYDPSYTTANAIPVDVTKQVDLMYSGSFVPASLTSPAIRLKMKHALSLLTFNIVPVNYSGAGNLTSLSINGEILYTTGTMDVSTGKITALANNNKDVTATFSKRLQNGGWQSDIPGLWSLPFNTKTGVVTLTAVVDGRTYTCALPEVEVKTGWQYIFRLAITDGGLEFDPSKTQTISLNVTTDEEQNFSGYGRIVITASGSQIVTPHMEGDAVFGTLTTPTGNSSYASAQTVTGLSAGSQVSLETWNSTGFVVGNLEGVGSIDISAFE